MEEMSALLSKDSLARSRSIDPIIFGRLLLPSASRSCDLCSQLTIWKEARLKSRQFRSTYAKFLSMSTLIAPWPICGTPAAIARPR